MKLLPNHWWENRFFPDVTPLDTLKRKLREWLSKIRIDLCWDEHDGFNVGAFVGDWKAARGPFLLHRQMEGFEDFHQYGPDPSELGPWRLMVAVTPKAFDGFDEGAIK